MRSDQLRALLDLANANRTVKIRYVKNTSSSGISVRVIDPIAFVASKNGDGIRAAQVEPPSKGVKTFLLRKIDRVEDGGSDSQRERSTPLDSDTLTEPLAEPKEADAYRNLLASTFANLPPAEDALEAARQFRVERDLSDSEMIATHLAIVRDYIETVVDQRDKGKPNRDEIRSLHEALGALGWKIGD